MMKKTTKTLLAVSAVALINTAVAATAVVTAVPSTSNVAAPVGAAKTAGVAATANTAATVGAAKTAGAGTFTTTPTLTPEQKDKIKQINTNVEKHTSSGSYTKNPDGSTTATRTGETTMKDGTNYSSTITVEKNANGEVTNVQKDVTKNGEPTTGESAKSANAQ